MTKDKWENELTPKQRWDVLVAMRGPDCHRSDPVKWFTSSVIRDHMSKVIRVGGLVNTGHLGWVLIGHGIPLSSEDHSPSVMRWDASHFFGHVVEAADVLGIHPIYVNGKVWLDAMTDDSIYYGYPYKLIPLILAGMKAHEWYNEQDRLILEGYAKVFNKKGVMSHVDEQ